MANLAIVGSHSTNGVAAIHSELLRTMTVKDLAEMFPERFNNKTNGVTPRRWLRLSNPALSRTITDAIGDGWIKDLSQLRKVEPLAADSRLFGFVPRSQARAPNASLPIGSINLWELVDPGHASSIVRSNAFTSTNGNC